MSSLGAHARASGGLRDGTLRPGADGKLAACHFRLMREYARRSGRRPRAGEAYLEGVAEMAAPEGSRGGIGGISLGGIIVIVGIVLMIVWSFWIGLIIALIGLIAFGGFARGRWY
jgi:hypothetical protein